MTKYSTLYNGTTPFSDLAPQFGLLAATPLSYTVPGTSAQKYRAKFSWPYDANVWVALNSTATLPVANTMNTDSVSTLRPDVKYVSGGDVLSFNSTLAVTDAGFELLEIPG